MAILGAAAAALLALTGSTTAQAQTWGARPAVHSAQAVNVHTTDARLRGSVTFNEKYGEWWFSYCKEADCANTRLETPHQEAVLNNDAEATAARTIELPISSLQPSTAYSVTLHVGNDTYKDRPTTHNFRFVTAAPHIPVQPVAHSATTTAATAITPNAATLNGTVVPGTTGSASTTSTAYFE
jgi:hypothetical protein